MFVPCAFVHACVSSNRYAIVFVRMDSCQGNPLSVRTIQPNWALTTSWSIELPHQSYSLPFHNLRNN